MGQKPILRELDSDDGRVGSRYLQTSHYTSHESGVSGDTMSRNMLKRGYNYAADGREAVSSNGIIGSRSNVTSLFTAHVSDASGNDRSGNIRSWFSQFS
eukprot:11350284-Ditylum_brightwellii.AAC.1